MYLELFSVMDLSVFFTVALWATSPDTIILLIVDYHTAIRQGKGNGKGAYT